MSAHAGFGSISRNDIASSINVACHDQAVPAGLRSGPELFVDQIDLPWQADAHCEGRRYCKPPLLCGPWPGGLEILKFAAMPSQFRANFERWREPGELHMTRSGFTATALFAAIMLVGTLAPVTSEQRAPPLPP